ncbi:amidohydrolase [Longimycelium tulufanense]|uniref:Amidohydrolase n=1 Tax=Longimycelium tulufanense TaxID=907463 RepID=A0A8J3CAG4_9PSEU|nr:amidohydrolase [Longimycelium tulufanense]GGM50663.1 amidohydrolase [Longimycelium tulufanense]
MLDVRLVNANILTMDPGRPVAREVGIWRGRIVGVDDAVASLPARAEVDLEGATVLPGFVDAHVHLAWAGLRARSASVAPSRRVADVLEVIRRAAAQKQPGEWVDVVGYDQRPLGRHLTAAELDEVAGDRKVFVVHDSGHACVVNSAVLGMLPAGVHHDNGVLAESGMAAVRELRQPYSLDELVDAIEHAARTCLAEGVTACAEAGIGGGLISHSPVELAAYQRALDAGRLPIRVQLMVAATALRQAAAHPTDGIPRAIDLGLRTGLGGERLSIGALKVFLDGGMMPRTAALTSPYVGLDHGGQLFGDPAELRSVIVDGHRAGWQLAIHAIGDRAVDLALDSLEAAQRAHPRAAARHRIEHAGLVRPDQLPRFAELGAAAVVQPSFLWYLGDDYAEIMGEERAPWLYRGKGFLHHGVPLVGSSDRPVTAGAPLRAIQFLVERVSEGGRKIGPDEAIGVDDALRAYTVNAAHACHREHEQGSIAPGKLADLVVLGADPRRVPTDRISRIDLVATLVGGEVAHGEDILAR